MGLLKKYGVLKPKSVEEAENRIHKEKVQAAALFLAKGGEIEKVPAQEIKPVMVASSFGVRSYLTFIKNK